MKRISREPETYVERRYGGLLMKKKFLSLMMIMVMAFGVFALTGCGGSDDSAESDTLVEMCIRDRREAVSWEFRRCLWQCAGKARRDIELHHRAAKGAWDSPCLLYTSGVG